MPRYLWIGLLLLSIACTSKPKSAADANEPATVDTVVGSWSSELKGSEAGLDSTLGGYRLVLDESGEFMAEWRGLVFSGTWKDSGESVAITVQRVFGKTMDQAVKDKDKPVMFGGKDLFGQTVTLQKGEKKLTLAATKDAPKVEFLRS